MPIAGGRTALCVPYNSPVLCGALHSYAVLLPVPTVRPVDMDMYTIVKRKNVIKFLHLAWSTFIPGWLPNFNLKLSLFAHLN